MRASDEHRVIERDERRGAAFALALAVHVLLAVFLVLSVQWRTQREQAVEVELWGGPPPAQQAVPTPPQPVVKAPEPEPEPVSQPEIVHDKAKPQPKEKPKPASVAKAEKPEKKPKPAEPGMEGLLDLSNLSKVKDARPNGRPGGTGNNPRALTNNAGAGAGGGGKPSDNYLAQVTRLIKSNTIYAGNKQLDSRAQLKIYLLPDGTVREVQVLRRSGDPAWAEAAQRAVVSTQKFPPLPGGKSFSNMREWTVSFCARDDVKECKM